MFCGMQRTRSVAAFAADTLFNDVHKVFVLFADFRASRVTVQAAGRDGAMECVVIGPRVARREVPAVAGRVPCEGRLNEKGAGKCEEAVSKMSGADGPGDFEVLRGISNQLKFGCMCEFWGNVLGAKQIARRLISDARIRKRRGLIGKGSAVAGVAECIGDF